LVQGRFFTKAQARGNPFSFAAMIGQLMNMTGLTVYESVPVEEQVTKFLQSRKPTNTVDATFIRGQVPASIGKEASSMWPADIEVQVPENWSEGEKVLAQGPHGRVLFELPEGCKPGTKQQFRLRPAADMRVEVPKDLKEGMSMTFEREDGTRISISVPQGKVSGDTFEVIPPAAMVLVPEDAQAGDVVCFPLPGPPSKQWFSAPVPGELILGKYFAARLPAPDSMAGHDGEKLPSPTAASETTSASDGSPAGGSDSDAL